MWYSVNQLSPINAWMSAGCIPSFAVSSTSLAYERSRSLHNEFLTVTPSAPLNASNCEVICRESKQTFINLEAVPSTTKITKPQNDHIKVSTSAIAGPARRTPRTTLIPEKVIF